MNNEKRVFKSNFTNILSSVSEIIKPIKSLRHEEIDLETNFEDEELFKSNQSFNSSKVEILTQNKALDKERYVILDSVVPLEIILPNSELSNKPILVKCLSVAGNHKIKSLPGDSIDFYHDFIPLSSYQVRRFVPCPQKKTWFLF
jgi:hypothetical protein